MNELLDSLSVSTNEKELDYFSKKTEEIIRVIVAENEFCSHDTFERLSKDSSYFVRKSLYKNKSVDLKILDSMYEREKVIRLKRSIQDLIGRRVTYNVMKYIKNEGEMKWKDH